MEEIQPTAPECWPRAWAPFDASAALAFWLANPLLLHHYPRRMATTAERAGTFTTNREKLDQVWRLRELRMLCRTRLPLPQGLPELTSEQMEDVVSQIPEVHERGELRTHAARLLPCEWVWLAAHITAVLAERAALLSSSPESLPAAA